MSAECVLSPEPFLTELLPGPVPPLLWFPAWLEAPVADRLLVALRDQVAWEQRSVNFSGRSMPVPRLVAWYGAEAYRYGGFTHAPQPMPWCVGALLPALQALVSSHLGEVPPFNSVLLNRYRDGRDSMSFHSDNELQLGPEPVIASLSLGACRTLQFRHLGMRRRLAGRLSHGSLLIMHGRSQADWQHAIPKEACSGERINLTFRCTGPLRRGPLRRAPG